MTKQRAIQILKDYVMNDLEGSDKDYVSDSLLTVADEVEIREIGLGWILDDEDEDDED